MNVIINGSVAAANGRLMDAANEQSFAICGFTLTYYHT